MSSQISDQQIKAKVGQYAIKFIGPDMVFGLGTGTTVNAFIHELAERVRQGLVISIVPTSRKTEELALEAGISIADLDKVGRLPLTIDGADEIDPAGRLIKGGGGALLQEKIVAAASEELIIIAENRKSVRQLGKFPLPVEVIPFGHTQIIEKLSALPSQPEVILRMEGHHPFLTDHQHWILDCKFGSIEDPEKLDHYLHSLPGVVETGLFIGMASKAVLGFPNGAIEVVRFKY